MRQSIDDYHKSARSKKLFDRLGFLGMRYEIKNPLQENVSTETPKVVGLQDMKDVIE